MTTDSIDELAITMAAEGCAETEVTAEPSTWRRNARIAAAQLGHNEVVIRVRDGILTACLKGWPRDAVERAVQSAALRRAAVAAWVEPLTEAARHRLRAARGHAVPLETKDRRPTTTLRVVREEPDAPSSDGSR